MKYQSFVLAAWMLINKVLRVLGNIIGVVDGVVILQLKIGLSEKESL